MVQHVTISLGRTIGPIRGHKSPRIQGLTRQPSKPVEVLTFREHADQAEHNQ